MSAYKIVWASSVFQLVERVEAEIEQGWEPQGGPYTDSVGGTGLVCQAMFKGGDIEWIGKKLDAIEEAINRVHHATR